jgi:small-conductance mechanosensitive channel
MEGLLGGSLGLLGSATLAVGVALLALLAHAVVYWVAGRAAARTGNAVDDALVRRSRQPARLLLPVLALFLLLESLPPPPQTRATLEHALGIALIAAIAWLLVGLARVLEDVLAARFPLDVKDNLTARRVLTQARLLRRVASGVIVVVAVSVALMTFPEIRHLGASLLASAGLAGLVVGMAARSAISNLLAGVQIALTEPIRIDDVVIVEGEWGWIEDIRGSYVVVRIWDLRRLIVPLTYFIERPFENWTRETADLLGTVVVYADYRVPVEEVRHELRRIVEASGMWDGKVCGLQVTNTTERTMELRALVSAPDSGVAWNLRCHVREKLIEYLQRNHPESLPRLRAELQQIEAG